MVKPITLDPSEVRTTGGRQFEGPDYTEEVRQAAADGLIHALPVEDKAAAAKQGRYLRRAAEKANVKLRIRTFQHEKHGWLTSYQVKEGPMESDIADDE